MLTPLQNAIETMSSNNKDLKDLVMSHNLRPELALDNLTRKLMGMIDAAVMGGVANYEKVSWRHHMRYLFTVRILFKDVNKIHILYIV